MADYTNVPKPKKVIVKAGPQSITYEDLQDLADAQAIGDEPMIKGNIDKKTPIQEITQFTHFHLWHESMVFDQKTGEKLSRPKRLSVRINEFEKMVSKGFFKGWTVDMIHDPILARQQANPKKKEGEVFAGSKELFNQLSEQTDGSFTAGGKGKLNTSEPSEDEFDPRN